MTDDFIIAWRNWIRADAPIANARERRTSAATYAAEVELDHVISRVHALGMAAMSGKAWRYGEFATDELAILDRILAELAHASGSARLRGRFDEYSRLTRCVLDALRAIDAGDP